MTQANTCRGTLSFLSSSCILLGPGFTSSTFFPSCSAFSCASLERRSCWCRSRSLPRAVCACEKFAISQINCYFFLTYKDCRLLFKFPSFIEWNVQVIKVPSLFFSWIFNFTLFKLSSSIQFNSIQFNSIRILNRAWSFLSEGTLKITTGDP